MTGTVNTDRAPMAVGPYSQAVIAGNMVFTAGELPVNPKTGDIPVTIEKQTEMALGNVKAILKDAGVKDDGIVSVTVYLTDINDFGKMNLVYAEHFKQPYPARSCAEVSALPKGVKIMVSAIGIIE